MHITASSSSSSNSTRSSSNTAANAACFSDDYVSNVCLRHLMRSCINCTINKQYTRSKQIYHHCPLKRTTTMTSTLKMTMVTATTTTTTTATATTTTTKTSTDSGSSVNGIDRYNHSHYNHHHYHNVNLCKSQGGASIPLRYPSTQSFSSCSPSPSTSNKVTKQQQQKPQQLLYTNTINRAPSTLPSLLSTSSPVTPSSPASASASHSSASASSSATLVSALAAASATRTSVSISSPYLHTVYSKKHMGRRKRNQHLSTTPNDGINSCLRILLIVSFMKPLNMWYHFIKSVILTSLKQPTERLKQQQQHSTNNNNNKSSYIKTTTSSASTLSSSTSTSLSRSKCIRVLPPIRTTSFITLLTIICLETILLSTMSSCAKTFYMHWNTSNSIFRIDNTDHIIDVNKGNLAFEFDQVHIICPVYDQGTYENETEKYIIYNVSKVEYETCRITNADPRVIAICDKPQKLMFFTITFRPFTPQPGGLEFLPGNDYYFISTSSKDDLYRRIGGRCSTDNMKVVFKVCCVSEEKNKTLTGANASGGKGGSQQIGGVGGGISDGGNSNTAVGGSSPTDTSGGGNNVVGVGIGMSGSGLGGNSMSGEDINHSTNINRNQQFSNHPHHMNNINQIGINGINTGMIPNGVINPGIPGGGNNNYGLQMNPMLNSPNGGATSINTNIDQFNRIPMQPNSINVLNNNIGGGGLGLGSHGGSGIMMTPGGHNGITMISTGGGGAGVGVGIPGIHQYHGQTGIRINNVPSTHHTYLKNINSNNNNNNDHDHQHYDKHPNEVVKNEELTYNSAASRHSAPFSTFFSWHWLCRIGTALKAVSIRTQTHYSRLLNYVLSNKQFVNVKSILYNNLIYSIIALFVILLIQLLRYNFVLKIITQQYNNNNNNNTLTSTITASIITPKINFLTSYDDDDDNLTTNRKFTDGQQQTR